MCWLHELGLPKLVFEGTEKMCYEMQFMIEALRFTSWLDATQKRNQEELWCHIQSNLNKFKNTIKALRNQLTQLRGILKRHDIFINISSLTESFDTIKSCSELLRNEEIPKTITISCSSLLSFEQKCKQTTWQWSKAK